MLYNNGTITEEQIANRLSTISISSSTHKHERVSLDLSSSFIRDLSPLSQFTFLRSIDVSSNRIGSLKALTPLEQLRVLIASHNALIEFPDFGNGVDGDAYPRLLTKVDLSFNEIGSIRGDIARYRYITDLNLQSNSLISVNWCQSLSNLQMLNVSHNHITDLEGLQGSSYLTHLKISNNALTTLQIAEPISSLRYVDASGNRINHVGEISDCFPNLAVLDLADNAIESLLALADLSDLALLRDLNLKGNAVTGVEHYRSDLVFLLSDLEHLDQEHVTSDEILQTEIAHGEHDYSLEGLDADSRHPRHNRSAVDIDRDVDKFWYRCAESGFVSAWEPFLRQARSRPLQSLTIDRIPIGIVGLKAVADAVLESPTITSLTLRHCLELNRWSSMPLGLYAAFRRLPRANIQHITLQGCHLSYEDSDFIAELIESSPVLTTLCLSDNRLGQAPMVQIPEGGKTKVGESWQFQRLLQSAAKSTSLKYLDLSNTDIIADGEMALSLARLVAESVNLIGVDLSRNRLSHARPLFLAFASTKSLQSIQFSCSELSPGFDHFALQQIGKSLASNAILISLDLSENHLGDNGVEQLVQTAIGCQLQKINLQNCDISDNGMNLLGQWLHSMLSLSSLNIAHNAQASAQSLANLAQDLVSLPALIKIDLTGNNNDLLGPYLNLLSKGNIAIASISHDNKLSTLTDLENSTTFASTLTHLDLSNHVLPAQRDNFIDDIVRHPNLTTLNLFGCQLSSADVSLILSSINLVRVNLGGPYISWDNLPTNTTIPSIQLLDISQACLFSQGVRALTLAISDPYCNLEQLCLDGCRLGDELSFQGFLEAMRRVQVLVLSNCALTDTNYKDLCEIATRHKRFQVLDLAGNTADYGSLLTIAQLIQSNSDHLLRIRIPGLAPCHDAEGSSLDSDGAAPDFLGILQTAIRSNEFLWELDASELNITRLSSVQKASLADALKNQNNSKLSRLALGRFHCNIGKNGSEEEDLLDNRIVSKLALGSLLSTVTLDDWSRMARV